MNNKRFLIFGVTLILGVSLLGCQRKAVAQSFSVSLNDQSSNILIAYFSTSEVVDKDLIDPSVDATTQASVVIPNMVIIAEYINEAIGGDMFSIRTVKKYPVTSTELNAMGYAELGANARPELSTRVENIEAYNTIFLCYPNWCGTIPMAVATFLESYDFSGKTIIASVTHFGSGFGNSIQDIKKLVPNADVIQGFSGNGRDVRNAKPEVVNWLKKL
jgi:flavodoxin